MSSFKSKNNFNSVTRISSDKVVLFLNDLRELLDKHNAKLYTTNCEVYMNNLGFIGLLEDNIETVEIIDGIDTFSSNNNKE
jgi:hypothetical protein